MLWMCGDIRYAVRARLLAALVHGAHAVGRGRPEGPRASFGVDVVHAQLDRAERIQRHGGAVVVCDTERP